MPDERGVASLRALGSRELPETIELASGRWDRVRPLQHSFFAATGVYANTGGARMFYKVGREAPFFRIPLRVLGRFLARRELVLPAESHNKKPPTDLPARC